MKKAISVSLVTSLFLLVSRCATFQQKQEETESNLTIGIVKSKIKKGETTQAEILQIFGSPNIITKNRDNDEVWNYSRMSYRTTSGADGVSFIFFGGSRAMTTATTASFDLIIIYDENDVVKDYSVIAAKF